VDSHAAGDNGASFGGEGGIQLVTVSYCLSIFKRILSNILLIRYPWKDVFMVQGQICHVLLVMVREAPTPWEAPCSVVGRCCVSKW
jgi:hypothetical protein